jgi:hypothetical protein
VPSIPVLFLVGAVILAGCDQPLVVRASPAPSAAAQMNAAAATAGHVDPVDFARARAGLDALASAWGSPVSTALQGEAANARHYAEALAKTLDPRPDHIVAEALRVAAARQTQPVHP